MIIFKYKAFSVDDCRKIINGMDLPGGEFAADSKESEDYDVVYGSEDFLGVFNREDSMLELYGTKNTNSINYYIKRFPNLDWDSWQLVRTKRW